MDVLSVIFWLKMVNSRLILLVFVPFSLAQLSLYGNWTPTVIRYCETLQSATVPLTGGVTCGSSSYNVMNAFFTLPISSTLSLGLINVGWITSEALKSQSGFWKTCKPYLVRLFDGIYTDTTNACALMNNPPSGLPNCTEDQTNLLYRSGSGYCMKEKVCGAFATIDFLAGPDNSSLLYSWSTVTTNALVASGFKKAGVCYGYKKVPNPGKNDTTMVEGDEQFY
ncbi:CW domain-containing protein [Caenorhabditis elegans]|uniref:CW domain-containing protein n=1 Tax=Caenorhabditis elegans TaxID=6239 RepID=O02107_CAEEL|nr:CW domain-containing protein [Caenorhabditis elegans]CCD63936.1 CW domain-containing protein [Caenorhabditis elegans]|eukprot:NP_493760.2 Uncharacterized protein CELE_W08F4.7 [Caenorhabditis elegans]